MLQSLWQKQAAPGVSLDITWVLGLFPLPFLLPTIADWPSEEAFLDKSHSQQCLAQGLLLEEPALRCIRQALDSPAVYKPPGHSVSEFAPLHQETLLTGQTV